MTMADIPGQIAATTPQIYSVFTTGQKAWILFLAAFASWFSTMSSMVYFPAITAIAEGLHCSIAQVNLTVTSYLVVSAIAPTLTGTLADTKGRRPLFIVMLAMFVGANIGLAVQRSFTALLLLRMVQSAGISGVFALAYGVATDIATPAERGGFFGVLAFCTNTAPAIGPVIGASLLSSFGWPAIFWFLAIFSSVPLVLVFLSLPETARTVVGNGSIKPCLIHRAPLSSISERTINSPELHLKSPVIPNPLDSFTLISDPQNAILIYSISILYVTLICIQASTSSLFIEQYGLNELQSGLVYIPFGFGSAIAAFLSGRLLNRDYRIVATKLGLPQMADAELSQDSHLFPIAHARLRSIAWPMSVLFFLTTRYGWALQSKTHIGVPLTLQFLIGAAIQFCFTMLNTLLLDLNNTVPSSVQAACNLVRCTLAAAGMAALQPLITKIGVDWYFDLVAVGVLSTVPPLFLIWRMSQAWRLLEFMRVVLGPEEREPLISA